MTPEEMRTMIVRDLDEIIGRPFLWLTLGRDQQRLVKAQREYWMVAPAAELQTLVALFAKEP